MATRRSQTRRNTKRMTSKKTLKKTSKKTQKTQKTQKNTQKTQKTITAKQLATLVRPTTLDKARHGFQELCSRECREDKLSGLARVGLPTLDYFFLAERLKAKTRKGISFYEAMNDQEKVQKLEEIVKRWKRDSKGSSGTSKTARLYYAFQLWYGTINQFRPAFAKWIFCSLGAKLGVLDFSAGWGGRCLAAMSMGLPYYGFDANRELQSGYTKMIRDLKDGSCDDGDENERGGDGRNIVEMRFEPSETIDFKEYRGKYDLVFTSPPYFTIEQYRGMPEYGSREGFIDKFFRPVIRGVWDNLILGGHMALNMPVEMYEAIRDELPPIQKTIKMPIHSRGGISKPRDSFELVYVWTKHS